MKNTTIAMTEVVTTNVEEFVAFVMDRKTKITHEVIEAQLDALGVEYRKRDTKEAKAIKWFNAAAELAADMEVTALDEVAATGETLVAAESKEENQTKTNTIEEEVKMTNTIKSTEVIAAELKEGKEVARGMKSLPTPNAGDRKDLGVYHEADAHGVNDAVQDMIDKVEAAKSKYLRNIGENEVVVVGISFYPEAHEAPRGTRKVVRETSYGTKYIGEVTVKLPRNYAQIKVWNKEARTFNWVEFADYDLDVTQRTGQNKAFQVPASGSGFLVLPIKEGFDGKPSVNLPVDMNNGVFYDVFRTSDVRFAKTKDAVRKDEPLFLSDNNHNFNAALTAFVQVFTNEFVYENPFNRHGFNESCFSCRNVVMLSTKDGVTDDMDSESKKSRAVLEQPDVMQLAQVGSFQPSALCMISEQFVDIDATLALNNAQKFEKTDYVDEDGQIRYQGHDEVMMGGKAVKVREVRENGTKATCGSCAFYHGNAPKGEAQVAKEKANAREAAGNNSAEVYVSPFYKTSAKVGRQALQTLTEVNGVETWVTKSPGEVEAPLAFRIKGIGVTVYGSDDLMAHADPEFVAPIQDFDARHAEVMKKVNQIFYAAFNYRTLDASQLEIVTELANNKPSDLTEAESNKWDKAVHFLSQAIIWDMERQEASKQEAFAQKFFDHEVEGAVELTVKDVMGETLFRAENDMIGYGLGYEDLLPTEFVNYLDEVALDYVYDVISNGTAFYISGGTFKDRELASGALQKMLQREVNQLVYGVRRSADMVDAIANLKMSNEVKAYIAKAVNVSK